MVIDEEEDEVVVVGFLRDERRILARAAARRRAVTGIFVLFSEFFSLGLVKGWVRLVVLLLFSVE